MPPRKKPRQATLAEKDALLSEMRHRIKNSLAMIASLVALEADHAAHPGTRESLKRILDRVKSVAKLHDLLAESDQQRQVQLAEYLDEVFASLYASYGPRGGAIVLDSQCAGIVLDARQAAPVGLIVNELATNAFKHGFPGQRGGIISVRLSRFEKQLTLEVSDNGVGLPLGFSLERSTGLGLQIVRMLVAQLAGTLEIGLMPATFRLYFTAGQ